MESYSCNGCKYKLYWELQDEGHCYMFEAKPEHRCMQYNSVVFVAPLKTEETDDNS